MKRLTEKNEFGDYVGSNLLDDECLSRGLSFDEMNEMTECFNKLGRLEDIEEALGIDLLTLFETLKQGRIWIKKKDQIISSCDYGLCLPGIGYYLICKDNGYWLPTKDYGKTWALTKEELE